MKVKILIADDSQFMRKRLQSIINNENDFEVIGCASNGYEAVEMRRILNPNLILMDLQMPVMNGLEAVSKIMQEDPVPILMFSSFTKTGAKATFDALEAGAIDYICKDFDNALSCTFEALKLKIRSISMVDSEVLKKKGYHASKKIDNISIENSKVCDLVVIGASTGGPNIIQQILDNLPNKIKTSIFICQHMPESFGEEFCSRLQDKTSIKVTLASSGISVLPNNIYVIPGQSYWEVQGVGNKVKLVRVVKEKLSFNDNYIDYLLSTSAKVYNKRLLALILTGMGDDGLAGCLSVSEHGGRIWVQNQASSAVWGMPKVVHEAGLSEKTLALEDIVSNLNILVGRYEN